MGEGCCWGRRLTRYELHEEREEALLKARKLQAENDRLRAESAELRKPVDAARTERDEAVALLEEWATKGHSMDREARTRAFLAPKRTKEGT